MRRPRLRRPPRPTPPRLPLAVSGGSSLVVLSFLSSSQPDYWFVDSGASSNMTSDQSTFADLKHDQALTDSLMAVTARLCGRTPSVGAADSCLVHSVASSMCVGTPESGTPSWLSEMNVVQSIDSRRKQNTSSISLRFLETHSHSCL